MSDGPKKAASRHLAMADAGRTDSPALPPVVLRRRPPGAPDAGLLDRLQAAVLQEDREARRAVLAAMQRAGICWDEIADIYIPEVSRRLGEAWCDDTLGFAEVTIGAARLQGMLREFGPAWAEESAPDPMAPNLLLVMLRHDAHTLGAMLVADRLRRARMSVRLCLGEDDDTVADHAATRRFDFILISASASVRLESVRDLVKKIRAAVRPLPTLVLGGTILDTDRDAKTITGVDLASCDLQKVMALCSLRTRPFAGAAPGTRAAPQGAMTMVPKGDP